MPAMIVLSIIVALCCRQFQGLLFTLNLDAAWQLALTAFFRPPGPLLCILCGIQHLL